MSNATVAADTAERILDIAERLVAQRGFNAVSYADIAAEIGISKPSLHYHYASKADLGVAMVVRYTERFGAALERLGGEEGAGAKLEGYTGIYRAVLADDRMCLCGMLAADFPTLPATMQQAVRTFFELNEDWLEGVLQAGRESGDLAFPGPARDTAEAIVSCLEGAMLMARPSGDLRRFEAAARGLLGSLHP